ncbi:SDR family NAD(P)-dependent oxidoreductase [Cupriavidus plantarum]|uniref:SDR family NAD(P)-dependent oxidoreductase n=1 Tax=Cupriavidus plantarum TaxID=942865 RepID=UPI00339D9307
MDVKNATVFITGASRGLGLAFAREAVRRGAAKVYAGMRNIDGFKEPGIVPVKIDVTDKASIAAAAKIAADTTLLINNAGIAALIEGPLAGPDDVVRQTYDALAAGKNEVMADKGTAVLKSTLAAEVPGYIEPPEGV